MDLVGSQGESSGIVFEEVPHVAPPWLKLGVVKLVVSTREHHQFQRSTGSFMPCHAYVALLLDHLAARIG